MTRTRPAAEPSQLFDEMFGLGQKSRSKGGADKTPDALVATHITDPEQTLLAASGVPATADSVAYEPVQKILAVEYHSLMHSASG